MEIFKNNRTQGNNELPLRKGFTVPDGAVNLAWHKSPELKPGNNLVVIDTTKNEGPNKSGKYLAYANSLGILEDEYGNQVWPEEFPIIGDVFTSDTPEDATDALPYAHVSRFFHIDYPGLGYEGILTPMDPQPEVKVVDSKGRELLDDDGNRRYTIQAVHVPLDGPNLERSTAYRLWVFFDTNPEEEELYLTYHKVEFDNVTNSFRDSQLGYKEPINAREYYDYTPEESEVIGPASSRKRIYSTSPVDLKDQIIGRTQPSYKGWQIQVPKKAIPDPRKFEVFRWRVACEYSRSISPNETLNNNPPTKINVGIVTFNSTGSTQSRSTFLFRQLNESSFNSGGIHFVNPLSEQSQEGPTQEQAAYWQVRFDNITNDQLNQFDILVWAPSTADVSVSESALQKIEYFTKVKGGTFVLETSSRMKFTGLPGITMVNGLNSLLSTPTNRVSVDTVGYYNHQDATPNSTTSGQWNTWPPRAEDVFTDNAHSSQIIKKLNFLGGWDLDSTEELKPTAYMNSVQAASLSFQYLSEVDESEWDVVIDAEHQNGLSREPILVRKKMTSGGSILVSTGCFFENHALVADGNIGSPTYQVEDLDRLTSSARDNFSTSIDLTSMSGEAKLRINLAMLSTAFRPSTNLSPSPTSGFNQDAERHSVTVYSDWQSSWVINAHDDVLSSEEKAKYNFALMPHSPDDPNPVWMRFLSDKTVAEIMAAKIDEIDPEQKNPTLQSQNGLNKRYTILVSNPAVETFKYNLINDSTVPAAWTYTFSSPFVVPEGLGPYSIREESIAALGAGEGKRTYPPKPYKVRSTASYVTTASGSAETTVTVKFTGKARRVYKVKTEVQEPVKVPVAGWYVDKLIRWSTDQNTQKGAWYNWPHHTSNPLARGITTYQDENYFKGSVNSWMYWGFHGTHSVNTNNRGNTVKNIQRFMNQFIFWGFISGPYLKEDGVYGNKTNNTIRKYQTYAGAIYIDGIVDAETWSLIGHGLKKLYRDKVLNFAPNDIKTWGSWAAAYGELSNLSDTKSEHPYMKASWATNGPGTIREFFCFTFDPAYSDADISNNFEVYELWIKPHAGAAHKGKDLIIDWLDVRNNLDLNYYWGVGASHGAISRYMPAGKYTKIPFSRRKANSVIFRVKNTAAAGWGTARVIGIEDVGMMARTYVKNTAPRPKPTVKLVESSVIEELDIEFSHTFNLKSGIPQKVPTFVKNGTLLNSVKVTGVDGAKSQLNGQSYPNQITEIKLNSYEIEPAFKAGSIDVTPIVETVSTVEAASTYRLVYNDTTESVSAPNFIAGPKIGAGDTDFYIKSLNGSVEPFVKQYGWVSKDQGILLITDEAGRPLGFPSTAPADGGVEATFARLVMDSWDTDQTLRYGFYDTLRNEWVENPYGEPDISYFDYVRRGTQNVYMAVQTTYEIDGQSNLPSSSEPINRPFKYARPIYAVKTRNERSVKLRNPSNELSLHDVWPILIGTGSFSKQISITNDEADTSTNFLRDYGGKTLTAHYILNEGAQGPWSDLLGKPYKDVVGEQPRLLSDETLKVNHYPIASVQEPTFRMGPADPVTPFFTVYRRETITGPWSEVALADIKEYNLNKGTITLKTPLADQDARLVKVNYTSRDFTYHYKFDGERKINLNPFIMNSLRGSPNDFTELDQSIYVYLKPSFVVDNATQNIIPETVEKNIVHITTSPTIFNPQQADYDPLAYRLGIVFVGTALEVKDLTILDTRARGGGALHDKSIAQLGKEARSYWDAPIEQAYSYQQGGFVIIRLPQDLATVFKSEESIRDVIERNIAAGVRYELENLGGKDFFANAPEANPDELVYLIVDENLNLITLTDGSVITTTIE